MTTDPRTGARRYETAFHERKRQAARRARVRAIDHCINENKAGTHGVATHGVRCERCHGVHSGTNNRKRD